ncbi:hypothetical protein [Plantactinospora soyae]|uniref:Uncharacterized protein n=1 Tax=Plantactinospora soyae TaxID=1544732 RepID=A0A927MC72_9ACTN|nr:hypothetical protein [Plantactinospora soyae]MBE1491037.1 hypothetical protein [Plantactinospora soyae]
MPVLSGSGDRPDAAVRAGRGTLVGRLTGPAVPAYAAVLAGLARNQTPMASFTAHQLAPGRYTAFVEGWPPD